MTRKAGSTPPYVPRKGLRAILDHAQVHHAGDVLSKDEMHKRGLSSHWTYPALAALRFLGILDDEDRLTGKHAAFSREKPDREAQQAILREAYEDFFAGVSLPLRSHDELRLRFQEVYDLSDRVTSSAFPVFQTLLEEAGFSLVESRERSREAQGTPPPPGSESEEGGTEGAEDADAALSRRSLPGEEELRVRHAGYQIVLNLQVSKYTTEKDIMRMIRTANRAIHLMKKSGDKH
jgi:hypothetical protein